MTVTQTSLFAYATVRPQLGERQRQVLDIIRKHPQCDNLFISKEIGLPINSITPRVKELRKLGRVRSVGQARNATTGRPTMRWEVVF